jgi:hypothetical protein
MVSHLVKMTTSGQNPTFDLDSRRTILPHMGTFFAHILDENIDVSVWKKIEDVL